MVEHREQLTTISDLLLKRETIEREEFEARLERRARARSMSLAASAGAV